MTGAGPFEAAFAAPQGPLDLRVALQGSVRRLHHINRYSSLPCIRPENVATHSWQMAFICLLIGTDLNERDDLDQDVDGHMMVNMEDLLRRAIVHDINEAMSGDVIRSYKYSHPKVREAMEEADQMNTFKLVQQFGEGVSSEILTTWQFAKDETLEGEIVRLSDIFAVVTYCGEEYRMGNTELDHVAEHAWRNLLSPYLNPESERHGVLTRYVEQMYPNQDWRDYRERPAAVTLEER